MSGVRRVRWTQHDNGIEDHHFDQQQEQQQEASEVSASSTAAIPNGTLDSSHSTRPWPFIPNNFTQQMPHNAYQDEDDYSDEDDQSNSDEDDETAFNQLYARNQSLSSVAPEITHERLEWQQMLQSVLLGEVIKSEKKRLSSSDKFQPTKPIQEIWLSIRAALCRKTILQEQKSLEENRKEIGGVLQMVMDFKLEKGESEALKKVADVLKKVDKIEALYTTRAEMILAHPGYGASEFQTKLEALNAWCTVTRSLSMQYKILRNWTGSEDLQIARKKTDETLVPQQPANNNNKDDANNSETSFVERLLKESALQNTFDKRILSALNLLLIKSKQTMIYNSTQFEEMNLPSFISQLRQLAYFPISLVEEALKLRLEYKDRMTELPKQMVDDMMEDYRGLISLACRVKHKYKELTRSAPGWRLDDEDEPVDQNYDHVLMEAVRFYFKLITWKLNLEKENNLRECEVMEKEWAFLKGTVCQTVDKADWECAEQFW
jgi:mitogen-activated protein kinase kinase kinase